MTDVLDIGAGNNPHPAATTTLDRVQLPGIDVVHDMTDHPWPFDEGAFERVIARHVLEHVHHPEDVFAEVARVLTTDGVFEVVVPLGLDARTDPTHVHEWTWDTPEYFTADPPYEYGWTLPFEIADRRLEWWCDGPFKDREHQVREWLESHGPGKWVSGVPGLSGEMTTVYRRRSQ